MNAVLEHSDLDCAEAQPFFAPTNDDAIDALINSHAATQKKIRGVASMLSGDELAVALSYFFSANRDQFHLSMPYLDRLFDPDAAVRALDAEYWQRALSMTDVEDFMPAARRREWQTQIRDHDTPAFDENTVRDNISRLMGMRMDFLAEMVDGIFRGLSGEHVTNRPEGFSKRMIIARCYSEFGYPSDQADLLHDMRCVMAKLMDRGHPERANTITMLEHVRRTPGQWHRVDGCAFRIRAYKKGTAHVEVSPQIAWRLNRILAHLHPLAIPSHHRQKPARRTKTFTLFEQAIPFAVLNIISRGRFMRRAENQYTFSAGADALNKHLKANVDRVMMAIGGVPGESGTPIYKFDYDASEPIGEVCASGMLPDQGAYQYYPTPRHLALEVIEMAQIEPVHRCLEPSAGQGALAQWLAPEQTTCVEISNLHGDVLKARGYRAECADFMAWDTNQRFDRVVMNPPFSEGRAQAHLERAASLLAPSGRLVAILPASFAGKDVLPGMTLHWSPIHDNAFAGASVRVVILVAQAPG